jgi:hypothetical protein
VSRPGAARRAVKAEETGLEGEGRSPNSFEVEVSTLRGLEQGLTLITVGL